MDMTNKLQKLFDNRMVSNTEIHHDKRCCYKKLYNCTIVVRLSSRKVQTIAAGITVLIRICKCNADYTDQSEFENQSEFTLTEIEEPGIEAYETDGCRYDVYADEGWFWSNYTLRKVGYLPISKLTGMR